jgi:hypothetical protein
MNLLTRTINYSKFSILLALANLGFVSSSGVNAQSNSFICSQDPQGIPTTYILVPDGQIPLFSWQSTYFKPPYTPMRRCQEVTKRLTNFHAQGILKDFYGGKAKTGESVICAGSCRPDGSNIIYTLKPKQNPSEEIQKLIAHKEGRTNDALPQSSASGDNSILNLEEYIKTAPVQPRSVSNSNPSNPSSTVPSPPPALSPNSDSSGGSSGSSRWGN